MSSLRQQLALRAFWLSVQNPQLSMQDVRKLAAEQLAAEAAEEQERRRREHRPVATPAHSTDYVGQLANKIMSMASRLWARTPDPPTPSVDHRAVRMQRASQPLPQPSPRPRRSLAQQVKDTFTKTEPPPPRSPTIKAECSDAQLIPDEEYAPRWRDETTRNWRKSIQDNESLYDERCGHAPSRSSLVK
jgi:hypothetical protein